MRFGWRDELRLSPHKRLAVVHDLSRGPQLDARQICRARRHQIWRRCWSTSRSTSTWAASSSLDDNVALHHRRLLERCQPAASICSITPSAAMRSFRTAAGCVDVSRTKACSHPARATPTAPTVKSAATAPAPTAAPPNTVSLCASAPRAAPRASPGKNNTSMAPPARCVPQDAVLHRLRRRSARLRRRPQGLRLRRPRPAELPRQPRGVRRPR